MWASNTLVDPVTGAGAHHDGMPSVRNLLLTTAVVGAALAPGAAAQAATILSSEPVPTHVAAWNGTVMWSQLDQATGSYRLVKSVDGSAPAPVAVPERAGRPVRRRASA